VRRCTDLVILMKFTVSNTVLYVGSSIMKEEVWWYKMQG